MTISIWKLKREGEAWVNDLQAPVARLKLGPKPEWTFSDPKFESILRSLFEKTVQFGAQGEVLEVEAYSETVIKNVLNNELPVLGLGSTT